MGLTFDADGSTAITTSETFLFTEQTVAKTYFGYVHFNTLAVGDEYIVRVYVKDANAATTRVLYKDTIKFSSIDGRPTYFIPPIPTQSFRVSVQKSLGTDRTVTWQRGSY